MAQKFIRLSSGRFAELEAITSSAGAGDAGKIIALDASGRLDLTFMPVGLGPDVKALDCTEDIAAGAIVNVYNSSGEKVRNADATSVGKGAIGFVLSAFTNGQTALVYLDGIITGLSGLTPGARYYMSTTPGVITDTPPSTSGNIVQLVGVALSATELAFEPGIEITVG